MSIGTDHALTGLGQLKNYPWKLKDKKTINFLSGNF
jgi:hypothetical protein